MINTGPTLHGWGYYERLLRCRREAALAARYEAHAPEIPKSTGLQAGIGYHLLQEEYHTREDPYFETDGIDLGELSERARTLAIEAFNRYRVEYTPKAWGQIVSVEQDYTGEIDGLPISIRPDVLFRVPKRSVSRVRRETGVKDIAPGLWILDWKRYSALVPGAYEGIRDGVRTLWYRCVWNATQPEPLAGMITHINVESGTFVPVVNRGVSRRESKRMDAILARIHDVLEDPNDARPENCVRFGRYCPFYKTKCEGF